MEIDSTGSVSSSLRLTVPCDLTLHLHGAHGRRFFPGLWVLSSRSSPLSSRLVHTAPFSLWKISPHILNRLSYTCTFEVSSLWGSCQNYDFCIFLNVFP
jgi:hypothetical protein